ncbi:DUF3526 domain-containing protein [Schlegelella sp. S2-27]|uniref:DUF3526 domain-containing protein n=1 Tax=Caldimonas mangrovi TaxID=2944811 RepID=A0ABT0YPK5_9BURK|nr:DUF3526 domain-containing protein [Caldimonas mangrovi]MCM5680651.1 DUF3526 domain-containing protein [Caldimonas mangrovi]
MRSFTCLRRVFVHEAKVLWADRSLWLVCGLVALLVAYSLFNGIADIRGRERTVADLQSRQAAREQKNIELLQRVLSGQERPDPFSNPADPASVGGGMGARYTVMPYLPLAPMAIGQSDMNPNYYKVSYRSKATFMYDGELESPWHLLSGTFDLAFVVVVLLPLAVFALSWNLLSAEREQGILKLLLSQPLSLTTLLAGKVALRAVALLGTVALVVLLVLGASRAAPAGAGAWGQLAASIVVITFYAGFWFALAAAVNALGRSSAFNALVLVTGWVLLVLVAPVVMNLAVSLASPAPSRVELSTRTRLITIDALNRYNDLLSADYRYVEAPESLLPKNGRFEVAHRRRAHYLMGRDTDREIEALLARFDEQLNRQQDLVERWSWWSPAVVTYEALGNLAGTGSKRYLHFKQQVESYHAQWRAFFEPKVLDGLAMTESDFSQLPRFQWQEVAAADRTARWLRHGLYLVLPALLLAFLGWRRSRTYQILG